MSVRHLEDLSNEIFYEIFEYIELYELFQAFNNLNHRFQSLLNYSFLSLQVKVNDSTKIDVENYCKQLIIPNKHRIISLYLTNRSDLIRNQSSFDILDSSFEHLQSLVLDRISQRKIFSFIPILSSLPRLFSITLRFSNSISDLTATYQLIFRLPVLRQIEISAEGYLLIIPLPFNTSEQCSHIKRLTINHACRFEELNVLLSNTPRLTHLFCKALDKGDEETQCQIPINMVKLRSVIIRMCDVKFDRMEIFIRTVCKQLRILCINTSEDVNYLDAMRWERLINENMPYLCQFEFEYHEKHYQNIELNSFHHLLARFISPFWVNRGCLFQITADIDYWPPIKVVYSIHSNRKQCTGIKLTIDQLHFAPCREYLADEFFSFVSNIRITQLEVNCKKLSYSKFIKLLSLLPNLNSLRVSSLSSFKMKDPSWSNINQITKLVIESACQETDLDKIQHFIDLCPYVKYLQVKCEDNFNIELLVRHVLTKSIETCLQLFCLCVPIATDQIIDQLRIMIDTEQLSHGYRLTRTTDRIYLQIICYE